MQDERTIAALDRKVHGAVLRPGDCRYDQARTIWNAMIERRPALVVRPAGVGDVRVAVEFAREMGLDVAVRGGGHNVAGTAVSDGGLLLDLSGMSAVRIDAPSRIARVGGGAKLRDLDVAASAYGLVTTGGVVSSTGVAGLTLGGGFGWLARKLGLAADNLLAAEVVTADGNVIRASADEHAELFWALCGGGGNFGVVTQFEFRLHPLAHDVLFGPTVYELGDAPDVLRRYREFCSSATRECCVWADLATAPPLQFIPSAYHGRKVLLLMQCYSGDPAEGERALRPLREFGRPLGDAVGPMPYAQAQTILDETYAFGARNYWSSQNYVELGDPTINALVELAATLPTPESDILICQLGGAIDDVPVDATAYPHRGVGFIVTPGARWRDPAEDRQHIDWARGAAARLAPGATGGAYVNFVAEPHGSERAAYGANLERLIRIKRQYDSSNFFQCNQNVTPDC